MITSIETCIFQRTEGGAKEMGLLLNEEKTIIDGNHLAVKQVWHYETLPGIAIHNLNIGGDYPKKGN